MLAGPMRMKLPSCASHFVLIVTDIPEPAPHIVQWQGLLQVAGFTTADCATVLHGGTRQMKQLYVQLIGHLLACHV